MWLLAVPVAYLIGTFPSAERVARARGVDIMATGSGNPGASNVARTLGWRSGVAVFGLDALKGVLAAAIGLWLGGRGGGYTLGAAAIVGHIWPLTRGLRGGKGVATAGGVFAVLHPLVAAITMVLWLLIARWWGKAALASIAAVIATVIGVAIAADSAWELPATGGIAALLIARHAGNIGRLLRGSEASIRRG